MPASWRGSPSRRRTSSRPWPGATWVGGRRWDLRFQTGEVLALPEGEAAARKALTKFASMDQSVQLLGKGYVRIDMRDPKRMLIRLSNEPGKQRSRNRSRSAAGAGRARQRHRRHGAHHLMKRPTVQAPRKLVTALDVGSSKVSALIAEPGDDGRLKILGTGQRQSQGVRRGFIADMEKTEGAIREAVEQAERIAATNIEDVFVGFSAGGLVSTVASVELQIGGRRIEKADIDQLLGIGRESISGDGRMILHALPALYTVDGLEGVKKPLGLHADKLAVDIHVIAGDPSPVRNLDLCVRSAHLGVEAIVASPVAAGKACLSDEERELGVALVELGAGVTNVSVFAGGMLLGLKSIPVGGIDITDDIASAFGTRRVEAERMKCFYGSATTSPRDNHDMIELSPIAGVGGGDGSGADHPGAADRRHPPAARASDRRHRRGARRISASAGRSAGRSS